MLDLLIGADDRTGALEVAGALADAGGAGPVVMVPWMALGDDVASGLAATEAPVVVVDLGSRHLHPAAAAARAGALDVVPAARHAHKIDSALRGNWAAEVVARHAGARRPVVVAAALPSAGRFVRDGDVRQVLGGGSVPVTAVMAADPRRPPVSSRPADHLRGAGLTDVTDRLGAGAGLRRWLTGRGDGAAVVDLDGVDDLGALAGALAGHDRMLFVGTAEAIASWAGGGDRPPTGRAAVATGPVDHVVVVVGSRHERAHRQVERLRARGHVDRFTLVVAPPAPAGPLDARGADRVARVLAHEAAVAVAVTRGRVGRVIVGGDTAAAVLGDEPRRVLGTVAPGAAWSVGLDHADPRPAVTRAGSFGDDDALLHLVHHLLHPTVGTLGRGAAGWRR